MSSRNHFENSLERMIFCEHNLLTVVFRDKVFVSNVLKFVIRKFLQIVDGLISHQDQVHSVAWVIFLVVFFKLLDYIGLFKSF